MGIRSCGYNVFLFSRPPAFSFSIFFSSSSSSSDGQTTSFLACVFHFPVEKIRVVMSYAVIYRCLQAISFQLLYDARPAWESKPCTFTFTQEEGARPHWYRCHDCGQVGFEGVGVVCANVCHKDHRLTYAKYGGFCCDCGARGNTYCKVRYVIFSSKYLHSIIDNVSESWQGYFSIR